jgi:hypothetical protein
MATAMAATAAVFLLIERIYGFGVLQGGFFTAPSWGTNATGHVVFRNHPQWARLFIRM